MDTGIVSCRSPAGLKGIKVWIIIPFHKYVNGKHMLLNRTYFEEGSEPMIEHLLAVRANEECGVLIAMPGDTVVLQAGDLHCVITVFSRGNVCLKTISNFECIHSCIHMFDHGQTWISKWDVERGLKFLERRTQKNFDEKLPLIYLKAAN